MLWESGLIRLILLSDRQTHTHEPTDRQADRQTNKQTNGNTNRQTDLKQFNNTKTDGKR